MAQLKRNQPPRACRNPPPVYLEPDLEEETDEEEAGAAHRKKTLDAKNRNRNQCRLRARCPEAPNSNDPVKKLPTKLDTTLWRELGDDLVECALSHLPVHKLWDTVMAISPNRWKQIHSTCYGNAHADAILAHGNHVDSSIGYIKAYTATWRSLCRPNSDNLSPPTPRVLEHTTQKWQTLPRFPEANVRMRLRVQSVSDGVILLVQPENIHTSASMVGYRHDMAVWNPVSQAHRWLPRSPFLYDDPDYSLYLEVVVVGRDRRSYKVIEFVSSLTWDRAPAAMNPAPRRVPARPGQNAISGYVVYDSVTATWGAIRPAPREIPKVGLNHSRSAVACDGCVCFVTVEQQLVTWERPRGIACYDPATDVWSEAFFPASFFDSLPGTHVGCRVHALLYASGKVYMIFMRVRGSCYSFFVASIALADVQSGVAGFEHVARVRESDRNVLFNHLPDHHPAPKCWKSRQNELILQRPCARSCAHRWYMLPVGSSFYLCAVLCGRWHRRFDLVAEVWTECQLEVPSDRHHDREVQTTVSPSGWTYGWEANVVPYIPSWVQV